MRIDKDLDTLIDKVDNVVDRQYDFIKEVKGIKETIWKMKAEMATMPTASETVVEPIVEEATAEQFIVEEAAAEQPIIEEVTAVEPIVEEVTAEQPIVEEAAAEQPIIEEVTTEPITEEIKEEVETIAEPIAEEAQAPVAPIAEAAPAASFYNKKEKEPTFEKSFDDLLGKNKNRDWERFIGENLFSKIGIGIILIGVFIGVKYSIDHNLISPAMRLVLGYLTGVALFVTGAVLKKKYENFSAVLVSGAMAIFYFVTFIAYSVFDFFPQSLTFILMFLFTAFTVLASLSYNQVVIALIGLVGSYAVPFLLSNNSGRVDILFAYTAIINIGVLVLSFYKRWNSLLISAFLFTWVLLLSTWELADNEVYFSAFLTFNFVTFTTFYLSFIAQKLHQEPELSTVDVALFLINSLTFYGLGAWLINNHYHDNTWVALFTLCNALLHFGVAAYFHLKKVPSTQLKYLVLVSALSFATLVIPIQFKGSWITLFWSAEAALLFWLGRTKALAVYERISYGVLVLATGSLLIDWYKGSYNIYLLSTADYVTPFANSLFVNALLYAAATTFMAYIHRKVKGGGEYTDSITLFLNIFSVGSLFYTFFREIIVLCDMRILQYPNALDNAMLMEDLSLFKNIWLLIYSLLFASGYSMLNLKYNKQKTLAEVQMGINFILGALFMTLGLYYFSELRERYISEAARGYQLSLWFLNIRYLGIIAFAGLCYTIWQLQKFLNLSAKSKLKLELLLHLVALWVSSSELLHWTELYESSSNYKLGLTILWGAYAVLLLVLGLFKKKKYLRVSGIVLISFSVLKLFFYDITHLDTLRKTIVFVSLGVLMLIASFLYNKYTKEIDEDKEEKTEEKREEEPSVEEKSNN
ncbi:DUF2339 domain-containing protein [Capnocytophaga leadbetteri]|uniref:DUF2339 domain-containing protein n=1 Tax=Capnocytophaga leadbetteri TaxID=327575 RepID=UPI0028E4A476|nr:DUF2339 domain-containing protein [Capnocytophaga leadbetteri]